MIALIFSLLFQSGVSVYLVKNNLHTGILFSVSEKLIENIPAVKNFSDYNFVDIGWGDEDFYQHPDPDILLGAKAILVPTNSVIRIEGKNSEINKIAERSDFCIKFNLTDEQLKKLCEFINFSFLKDEHKNFIATSQNDNNRIIFYKSGLKYHLFNTCNTWIAEAFENSGFDVSSSGVITAENLFEELSPFGIILKHESKNN
ncbi:MAG: DUF2459 domain-containing protein [Melioribacteraceae bacterium]|nr:MAG: DUF2459 domain-containing protein [Melioribacteraceae bacterium]